MNNMLDKVARKIERIAIPDLMKYIVLSMGAVFILDMFFQGMMSSFLIFNTAKIMAGQVWRVVSFIFIPINSSPLFVVFALYFYWFIGQALEGNWGHAKFNLFYLLGIVGTVIAGFITGFATNHYLNMSLFFAFALIYPNYEVRLFFVLPLKVKWLALLNLVYFAYEFIFSFWPRRIALIVSLLNVLIFFQGNILRNLKNKKRKNDWKQHFRN